NVRARPACCGTAAGFEAGSPTAGEDRVRSPGPSPRHRGQSHRNRSGRAEKRGYQGSSVTCPHCQEAAKFQRWQGKTVVAPSAPCVWNVRTTTVGIVGRATVLGKRC